MIMLEKILKSVQDIAKSLVDEDVDGAVNGLEVLTKEVAEAQEEAADAEAKAKDDAAADADAEKDKEEEAEEIKKTAEAEQLKKYADLFVSAENFSKLMSDFKLASAKIEELSKTVETQTEKIDKLEGQEKTSKQPDEEDIKKSSTEAMGDLGNNLLGR